MGSYKDSLAMQRISRLVDEKSFIEIGSLVTARNTDFNLTSEKTPSDGVITGHGLIDGNLVYVYSQDVSVMNGTIGEMHAKKIEALYDMALKTGAPVIGFLDCGGVRLQESIDALDGLGRIYAKQVESSGIIPQITAVFGKCGGGLTTVAALSDFVFVEKENGKFFVNPKNAIKNNVTVDTEDPKFQSEETGVIDQVGTEDEIICNIRELVTILPLNNEGDVYTSECSDDLNRECENMDEMKDSAKYLLQEISDDHFMFEVKRDYAKNVVTGFIKLNGMVVGAVANNLACYDIDGNEIERFSNRLTARECNKITDFVEFCDAFTIPVLTLTDVNGFNTGMCSEKNLAKSVAKMVYAFSRATTPKVNIVIREAFGSPYICMNSKALGADFVYAWENAKIGTMEAQLAAKIMYNNANSRKLAEKTREYTQLQNNVLSAARRGDVDRIINPMDTRRYLINTFEVLYTKHVLKPAKKHGTK